MPEILTESFCERCGTRYTFESAAPAKAKKLGRFMTTAKGLRNYVMSDDTSLDEAMAAARSDDEREQTSHQLDAFHATFNFCMSCRQYTCGNCWNEVEGRCLTCSPHLGHEILPAPFPELPAPAEVSLEAWPEADIGPDVAAADVALAAAGAAAIADVDAAERLDRLSAPPEDVVPSWLAEAEAQALAAAEAQAMAEAVAEPEMELEPETPVELAAAAESQPAEPVAEPMVAAADEEAVAEPMVAAAEEEAVAATVEPIAAAAGLAAADVVADADADDRAAAAALKTSLLFAKFRPGQSIDDELEAYEAAVAAKAAAEAGPAPEPAPVAAPEPLAAEAEAVAVAAEAEPEPVAATLEAPAVEPEPIPVEPEPVAAAAAAADEPARTDIVEQPTWRIVAPETGPVTNGHGPEELPAAATAVPPPPAPAAQPEWPTAPEWPQPNVAHLSQRRVSSSAALDALWAASARDVVAPAQGGPAGGVQTCNSCGLSLSANARFCRRCGTRQEG